MKYPKNVKVIPWVQDDPCPDDEDDIILPPTLEIRLFDFRRYWTEKVKPHLFDQEVQDALNSGMQEYLDAKKEMAISYYGAKITNPRPFIWVPGSAPYVHDISGFVPFRTPVEHSLRWYQCFDAGDWLVEFEMELGKKIFPDLSWFFDGNDRHLYAQGFSESHELCVVFDLLYFDLDINEWMDYSTFGMTTEEYLKKWYPDGWNANLITDRQKAMWRLGSLCEEGEKVIMKGNEMIEEDEFDIRTCEDQSLKDNLSDPGTFILNRFDFRKHWSEKIVPHLYDEDVQEALDVAMQEYLDAWKEDLINEDVEIVTPGHFEWVSGLPPYLYEKPDEWDDFPEHPQKHSLEWYQCFSADYYLALFAMKLGEKVYPDYDWYIRKGAGHSFAFGRSEVTRQYMVFDLFFFDMDMEEWADFINDQMTDDEYCKKWRCPTCQNKQCEFYSGC